MSTLTTTGLEHMIAPLLHKSVTLLKLKKIHSQIVKLSLSQSNFLITKMIDICDRNKQVNYAMLLFYHVIDPNVFLYNAMVRTYTHSYMYVSTLGVYKHMLREAIFPDKFTYPFVIRSCGGLQCVYIGMQVHGYVCKFGLRCNDLIQNSLLDMYVKCEDLQCAHKVFDEMTVRDVISWNSLITGYVKIGQVKKARSIFEDMPDKSIVSWTAMITGYTRVGSYIEALDVFRKMQTEGVKPDYVSLVSVLPACAHLGALEVGKWIHFYADKNGFLKKICLANALLEMYAKCGGINEALQVFEEMKIKDVISWSTMIVGFANHGKAPRAIELFREMQKTKIKPNEITFVGVLSACAHAGLLDEGLECFYSMKKYYNIDPGIEHYGCLVDLLGRTGHINRALEFINIMPMKPDAAIWGSLLSSCRTHNNLEIAVLAMENLLELEPDDSGNYVLLSNIYAKLGKWEAVSKMRKLMRSKSMRKTPGCSLIEVDNVVQEFSSGDNSKTCSDNKYRILELLALHNSSSDDYDETVLRLSYNQLTGSIPTQLGSLKKLNVLSLQSNQLTGAIPTTLEDLSLLMRLDLSFDRLFGSIPSKLADAPLLEILDVQNNTLSANVPLALKRLVEGFRHRNNPWLCGDGFKSLRICIAMDHPNPNSADPYNNLPKRDIPETANLMLNCSETRCSKSSSKSKTQQASVLVGVIVVTTAFFSVGLWLLLNIVEGNRSLLVPVIFQGFAPVLTR